MNRYEHQIACTVRCISIFVIITRSKRVGHNVPVLSVVGETSGLKSHLVLKKTKKKLQFLRDSFVLAFFIQRLRKQDYHAAV